MREYIREILEKQSEQKYREFSSSLIPNSKPLIGVRLPELRKLAKELVKKEDWRQEIICYDGEFEDVYFEEVMLRGMMIGYGTKSDIPCDLQNDNDNNKSGTYNIDKRSVKTMFNEIRSLKKRDFYLNKLIAFQDTEPVKVITGIRRCGKSSLMKLMIRHLRESGISDEQIIAMNFESME